MVDARARARARSSASTNVEFRVLDGEWIDLELASVDAVLCRWGYMLMVDPAAALRETRRVLRSGGRLALAVWDERERNPWSAIPDGVLVEHGLASRAGARRRRDRSRSPTARCCSEMLEEAGFTDIEIDAVDDRRAARRLRQLVGDAARPLGGDARRASSRPTRRRPRRSRPSSRRGSRPTPAADGALAVPGRTLVAVAEA